jgi:hypothetical protein
MPSSSYAPALKEPVDSQSSPRNLKYGIKDLIRFTRGTVAMKTVEHVTFRSAQYKYDRIGRIAFECITATNEPGQRQRLHRMRFYAQDPFYSGRICDAPAVMATCDCLYWLYRCEYAWWSKGLGEIIYSNGAYPLVTNPLRRIYMCKHLLRSGSTAITKKL